MAQINRVRGTNDFLYEDSRKLRYIEQVFAQKSKNYNFEQIRIPIFEYTELFQRGIGEATDIVSKEMFTFLDRGNRSMTLRPEGTAGIVRAVIENSLINERAINKIYYIGSMYRAERPQKGRYREFNQYGIECIGTDNPYTDAEVIALNLYILNTLSANLNCSALESLELEINTVGCQSCKPNYNEALRQYLDDKKDSLCAVCQNRYEKNILRILDCKNASCAAVLENAPQIYDHVCSECKEHFDSLCFSLKEMNIDYTINSKLVRGLDYYTKTAFEIKSNYLGTQSAVAGGGRYDNLIATFNNGKAVPAVGSAMGIERLLIILEDSKLSEIAKSSLDVFVILFKESVCFGTTIINELRKNNISVDSDLNLRSIKSQFKSADKSNAKYCLIIGSDEIENSMATLRDMHTGIEQKISFDKLSSILYSLLHKN